MKIDKKSNKEIGYRELWKVGMVLLTIGSIISGYMFITMTYTTVIYPLVLLASIAALCITCCFGGFAFLMASYGLAKRRKKDVK